MRFEPNLIPADEPEEIAGGHELPGDLAALAQQLTDDAAYLSRVYPASRADVALPAGLTASGSGRRLGRPLVLGIGASAVAAAIVLVVAIVDWPLGANREAGNTGSATASLENRTSIEADQKTAKSGEKHRAGDRSNPAANSVATLPVTRPVATPNSTAIMGHRASTGSADETEAREWAGEPSPLLLLREVTGPELEALFDLMEREPTESTGVSI
jgi:hypothetical protein